MAPFEVPHVQAFYMVVIFIPLPPRYSSREALY